VVLSVDVDEDEEEAIDVEVTGEVVKPPAEDVVLVVSFVLVLEGVKVVLVDEVEWVELAELAIVVVVTSKPPEITDTVFEPEFGTYTLFVTGLTAMP
jgi:hypothetical protein